MSDREVQTTKDQTLTSKKCETQTTFISKYMQLIQCSAALQCSRIRRRVLLGAEEVDHFTLQFSDHVAFSLPSVL